MARPVAGSAECFVGQRNNRSRGWNSSLPQPSTQLWLGPLGDRSDKICGPFSVGSCTEFMAHRNELLRTVTVDGDDRRTGCLDRRHPADDVVLLSRKKTPQAQGSASVLD